jgi:hypothetical protein
MLDVSWLLSRGHVYAVHFGQSKSNFGAPGIGVVDTSRGRNQTSQSRRSSEHVSEPVLINQPPRANRLVVSQRRVPARLDTGAKNDIGGLVARFHLNLSSALNTLLSEKNVTWAADSLKVTQPTMGGMLQREVCIDFPKRNVDNNLLLSLIAGPPCRASSGRPSSIYRRRLWSKFGPI